MQMRKKIRVLRVNQLRAGGLNNTSAECSLEMLVRKI